MAMPIGEYHIKVLARELLCSPFASDLAPEPRAPPRCLGAPSKARSPSVARRGFFMSKPIMVDGVAHRMRRGKLVPIPREWLGKVTSRQTLAKREDARRVRRTNTKQQAEWPSSATVDKRKVRVEDES
jgi:hypothetical protein